LLDYQLLSPEENVDEVYPYRRVWRSLVTELLLVLLLCGGLYFAVGFGVLQDTFTPLAKVGLSLAPVVFFYAVSIRRERRAIRPRGGLLRLFVYSTIATNGLVIPITELLITPELWLAEGGFFARVIGYTLTLGVVAAGLFYAVPRYTVWPDAFQVRVDGIAYSVPVALGYATVLNLRLVLDGEPTMDAMALRVLVNVYFYTTISAIMGYFLAELAIGKVQVFWLPLGLFTAAFVGGVFFSFRRIAIVAGLGSRDIGAFFLVIGFAVVVLFALSFLIENADERMAALQGVRRIR
jgi:hypothetical protein